MKSTFRDRTEAGENLAARLFLRRYRLPVVLALPRGGVVVGFEVAKALHAPLDICPVRKIGAPSEPEFAIGALADGEMPHAFLDHGRISNLGIDETQLANQIQTARIELARRERLYRCGHPAVPVTGRTVVLVDDGIATGWSVRAALRSLSGRGARRVVLAVPVVARVVRESLEADADEVVSLLEPADFRAVADYYADFTPVGDSEVIEILGRMRLLEAPCLSLSGPDDSPTLSDNAGVR